LILIQALLWRLVATFLDCQLHFVQLALGLFHLSKLLLLVQGLLVLLHPFFAVSCFAELFLLHIFFLVLELTELVENVLVVQDGVRKLVSEGISLQEARYALFYNRHFEELVDCRTGLWVPIKHAGNELVQLRRVRAWQLVILTSNDLLCQLMQGLRIEGWLQRRHLV
jgi:hypothetical protein